MLWTDELFDHVGEYFSRAFQHLIEAKFIDPFVVRFNHSFDEVVGVTGWGAFFDSCVPCLVCIVSWWVWNVSLPGWWNLDGNYLRSASGYCHATDDARTISNFSIVICFPNQPCLALCVTAGAHGLALTFYPLIRDVVDGHIITAPYCLIDRA